jgi:hypothetical protein
MVRVVNKRWEGTLFHYAHLCVMLFFPEILLRIDRHIIIFRQKNLNQTLGNMSQLYEQIFGIQSLEVDLDVFESINLPLVTVVPRRMYTPHQFSNIREFLLFRFPGISRSDKRSFPRILLIERENRIDLIDDPVLKDLNTNVTVGKERRDISDIPGVQTILESKWPGEVQVVQMALSIWRHNSNIFTTQISLYSLMGCAVKYDHVSSWHDCIRNNIF